jgi:hypothetical protein
MKTTFYHWPLAIAACACFIISFFVPAFDQMPGWKAALLYDLFWQQAMQGNLFAVHYLVISFSNLLMIVSPFFMVWGRHDARFVKWLRGLSLLATVLVWLFVARLLGGHLEHDLRIGCYLWATSFLLLTVASFFQPVPSKAGAARTI